MVARLTEEVSPAAAAAGPGGVHPGPRPAPLLTRRELTAGPTLIVSPHADDEMIGCGGWLVASRGALRQVVYVTSRDATRRAECEAATRDLGLLVPVDLDLPEGRPWEREEEARATARLAERLLQLAPLYVFVANQADPHPDHRRSHDLLRGALAATAVAPWILQYEGLVPLAKPNRWLDVTTLAADKELRLKAYASQERRYGIAAIASSLGSYRGRTLLRRGLERAEAYWALSAREYLTWPPRPGC